MKKILYICPHLSTGGMPQYVVKQIEEFRNEFEIRVVEWENVSDEYVVQKNRIRNLIGSIYSLPPNKELLINIIKNWKPDIVHFQEIPESFIPNSLLDKIYNPDREYFILVTTHSSLTDSNRLKYLADKFILVNEWSKRKFEPLGIDCDIWEYPIENKRIRNILNVGLFTPGKNQGEIFDIARHLPKDNFIFIGNQAPNFKDYWEPLMVEKPANCLVLGEKHNVEDYYNKADIFYFSSKFELNPLVVKEALSYGLPVLMYKLETYLDTYDNNPLVHYLNNLDQGEKIELIQSL